jgi:peptide/nickel transport system substrate-binding protein
VAALGVMGAASLGGCSQGSSTPGSTASSTTGHGPTGAGAPNRGGSLTVGTMAEIDGFYPASNHWDTNGLLYANAVYDPLMAVAANGTIRPYLAGSMASNAAQDAWTMTLRPGVLFSDGSALTASVVKANFDALKASPLAAQALQQMSSVETPDAMTVVFTLDGAAPDFPVGLTTQAGYMVGEAMIEQASSHPTTPPTPVGTGPFVYSQWQVGTSFTATRNPHYWRRDLPYLDQITFKPIPDTSQREATLKAGGVDLIISLDPTTVERFAAGSGYRVIDSSRTGIGEPTMGFMMLNTVVPPTDDTRIRQALAKGMDQSQLQKLFWGRFNRPANGLFVPGSPYYSATGYPAFDPSEASSLVAAYKAEHDTPSLQILTTTDPRTTQLVEVIQQMWQQVGFHVSIDLAEQAEVISNLLAGKFQAVPSAQFGAVDPNLNYVWLSTTTATPVGTIGLNFPRNRDPQIQSALLAGRAAMDQASKVEAYRTINQRLAQDLPYLWIAQDIFVLVADGRVQGIADFTLPDGTAGYSYNEGVFFPAQVGLTT